MSYPRYHNVQRVDGGAMSFEAYLKQIRLLYPNLPDLYVSYLQLIYEFNAEQLDRMLQLQQEDIAAAIFDATLAALQNAKNRGPDAFMTFVEAYQYQDVLAELFEIGGGLSFEEWLDEINKLYPDEPDAYLYYITLLIQYKTMLQEKHLPMVVDDPVISGIVETVFQNDLLDISKRITHASDNRLMTETVMEDGYVLKNSLAVMICEELLTIIHKYFQDHIHLIVDYSNDPIERDVTNMPVTSTFMAFDQMRVLKEMAPGVFRIYAEDEDGPNFKQQAIELFDIQAGGGDVTVFAGRVKAIDSQMTQVEPGSRDYNRITFGEMFAYQETALTGGLSISGVFNTPVSHVGFEVIAYEDTEFGSTYPIGFAGQTLSFDQYPAIHDVFIPLSRERLPAGPYKLVFTIYAYADEPIDMDMHLSGLHFSLIANNFTCELYESDIVAE